MASNRIFLGVDPTSNLAVSLEADRKGYFYLSVTSADLRNLLCRFICSDEDLDQISSGKSVEMNSPEGCCSIRPSGDQVIFEIKRTQDRITTTCALSANSFSRVVRLAKSRAYVG